MQTSKKVQTLLSEHPFFQGINPWYLEQLAGYAQEREFKEGEHLIREGAEADKFFLILEGRIAVGLESKKLFTVEQHFQTIQTFEAGEIVGWSWLLPPYTWHFDAKAIIDSKVVVLNGKYLRAKCEEDKELGFDVLKRLNSFIVKRLNAARSRLMQSDLEA